MRNVDGTASPLAFFGAELRRIRMEAGLSQEQLGQRIGYSGTLIGKVEIGQRAPSEDLAGRCDEALETKGLLPRIYDLARRWDGGYRPGSPDGRKGSAPPRLSAGGSPCWFPAWCRPPTTPGRFFPWGHTPQRMRSKRWSVREWNARPFLTGPSRCYCG